MASPLSTATAIARLRTLTNNFIKDYLLLPPTKLAACT
jgi:hypothetical protein